MPVPHDRVALTLEGCLQGARMTLPLLPSIVVFAAAFGSLAAQKGMTRGQTLAMSGIVFGGASQMVSIEIWRELWSPSALLEIMAVTAFVNARMVLMGASLQPWLKHAAGPRQALMLFLLTDANWLLGMRYRAGGGHDLGIYLGSGLLLWVVWVAATLPGYLAGALVPDPPLRSGPAHADLLLGHARSVVAGPAPGSALGGGDRRPDRADARAGL